MEATFVVVHGLLIVVASLVEHTFLGARASVTVACGLSSCGSPLIEHRLNSCGTQALLLRGMWDLPGPGIEPVSPALAMDSLALSHQQVFLTSQSVWFLICKIGIIVLTLIVLLMGELNEIIKSLTMPGT